MPFHFSSLTVASSLVSHLRLTTHPVYHCEYTFFPSLINICSDETRSNTEEQEIAVFAWILLATLVEGCHYLGWRLNKLDQYPFSAQRFFSVPLGMYEGNIVATRTLPDTARREAHATLREPLHAFRQRINPQADVVESGHVNPVREDGTARCRRRLSPASMSWFLGVAKRLHPVRMSWFELSRRLGGAST